MATSRLAVKLSEGRRGLLEPLIEKEIAPDITLKKFDEKAKRVPVAVLSAKSRSKKGRAVCKNERGDERRDSKTAEESIGKVQ